MPQMLMLGNKIPIAAVRASQVEKIILKHINNWVEPCTFCVEPKQYTFSARLLKPRALRTKQMPRECLKMKAKQLPLFLSIMLPLAISCKVVELIHYLCTAGAMWQIGFMSFFPMLEHGLGFFAERSLAKIFNDFQSQKGCAGCWRTLNVSDQQTGLRSNMRSCLALAIRFGPQLLLSKYTKIWYKYNCRNNAVVLRDITVQQCRRLSTSNLHFLPFSGSFYLRVTLIDTLISSISQHYVVC